MTDLPPTEEHQPAPDEPPSHKRRWLGLSTPVAIAVVVAIIAWGIPIAQGFHFGCNVFAGDIYRESRLGIQMCRAENQAEANAKKEKAEQEQHAKEKSEAEEKKGRPNGGLAREGLSDLPAAGNPPWSA